MDTKYLSKTFLLLSATVLLILFGGLISCRKFLEAKTDKKLVIPTTIQDAQALLNSYELLNGFYPAVGNEMDDNFFLSYDYWNSTDVGSRNSYVWEKENYYLYGWEYLYQMVLYSNIALETVQKVTVDKNNINSWKETKGAALFFRAYAFYQIAQYYSVPYSKYTATSELGIPLRLSSDVNIKTTRLPLQETYDQIISDYLEATQLLPNVSISKSLPSKAAAYGALARTYLMMGNFRLAEQYSDSCLQTGFYLYDYNLLNASSQTPFEKFNKEVIFHSTNLGSGMLTPGNWNVDSTLFLSYAENDLRKSLFYEPNGDLTFGFKGNYDGSLDGNLFNGIAFDEIFLISAECKARIGKTEEAMNRLNTLLITRWKTGTFLPYSATNADDALQIILAERRKELVLRGLRWFDLRRLNQDPKTSKHLVRILNGEKFELPPNDLRYTLYIPVDVIKRTGIKQNKR